MRIMAIDYGDARTGIAISDITASIVGTVTVIRSWNADKTAAEIKKLIEQHGVERLVMGFPKNMDGTEGPRAELYRAFAEKLTALTGMEVILRDERRTTIEAHQILSGNGKKMKEHRENVDAVAASLILESYLGFLKNCPGK